MKKHTRFLRISPGKVPFLAVAFDCCIIKKDTGTHCVVPEYIYIFPPTPPPFNPIKILALRPPPPWN